MLNFNYKMSTNISSQINSFLSFPVNLGDLFSPNNQGSFPNNTQFLSMGPGLYIIICSTTNKVYFGESSSVVHRLGTHFDDLIAGKHECTQMQEDWAKYGHSNFIFASLSVGPQWSSTLLRRETETKLVVFNQNIVYNKSVGGSIPKKQADIFCKVVSYKSTVYRSIADASRKTGVSKTHIGRLLRDPQNKDWEYASDPNSVIDESLIINAEKSKKVKVGDKIYRSIRDASKMTGIPRRTLQRRLESTKLEHADISYVVDE